MQKSAKIIDYFKWNGGEYDMVIYEIKHSQEINEKQTRHLRDYDKSKLVEKIYGKIVGKYVLYRWKNTIVDGIEYLNVEQFLCE